LLRGSTSRREGLEGIDHAHLRGVCKGRDLVKLYRKVKDSVKLKISEGSLARLSAYYTQARYPNAGIERLHEEIFEDMAGEAVRNGRGRRE